MPPPRGLPRDKAIRKRPITWMPSKLSCRREKGAAARRRASRSECTLLQTASLGLLGELDGLPAGAAAGVVVVHHASAVVGAFGHHAGHGQEEKDEERPEPAREGALDGGPGAAAQRQAAGRQP